MNILSSIVYKILHCILHNLLHLRKERVVESSVSSQKEYSVIILQTPFSFSWLPAGHKLMDYTV